MVSWLMLVSLAEAKKPKTPPPPPVGWYHEDTWKGDCYNPPNFDAMSEGDRRLARQDALQQVESQWRGERKDGVTIPDDAIEALDNVLLAKPNMVEQVSRDNLSQCKAFRAGGSLDAWVSYVQSLPPMLTKGDCSTPLTQTYFNYLDIGTGWQQPLHICKGNKAHIFATTSDKYRITETGPYITVTGDASSTSADPQYPCHGDPQCLPGELLGKFTTDAGVEVIFVVGADTVFTAPENGTITIGINDFQWYDNHYFKNASIEDRTAFTIEPAR